MNTGEMDADYFDPLHNIPPRAGETYLDPSANDPHWQVGKFWSPIGAPANHKSLRNPMNWQAAFVAGNDVDPYLPIQGRELPFRGECAGALQIAINVAARSVLGDDAFDKATPSSTIKLGEWQGSNSATYMEKTAVEEPPIYGDYMYLRNDPRYPKLAPNGFWQGLNSLYAGDDQLGVARFSGLGVSWQTAQEIRTLMQNAFLGDTGQKADPTSIKFIERADLVLHKPALDASEQPRLAELRPSGDESGLTPRTLEGAGFAHEGGNIFARSNVSLGELGEALNFSPSHLSQSFSASAFNPSYRVVVDGTPVVIDYHQADENRQSPSAVVSAYAKAV